MTEAEFWRRGYIYLFGAVFFLCCAAWTGNTGLRSLSKNLAVKNWNNVSAKVTYAGSLPLYHQQEIIGAYAIASYSYRFKESEYSCNDVAPDPSFSMDTKLVASAVAYLKGFVTSKEEVVALVNPEEPGKAYLIIDSPMGSFYDLLISGIFFMLTLVLFVVFWNYNSNEDKRQELKKQYPSQPWRWEKYWRDFKISDEPHFNRLIPLGTLSFILVTAFLGGSIFIFLGGNATAPVYVSLGFLLFAVIGSFYLLWKRHLALLSGTGTKLELEQLPVVPGDSCRGILHFQEGFENEKLEGIELGLVFEDKVAYGSKGRVSLRYETVEGAIDGVAFEIEPSVIHLGRQMGLKFELKLSDKLDCTDLDGDFPKSWKLIAKSRRSDLIFYEEFKIPVFKIENDALAQINSKFPI